MLHKLVVGIVSTFVVIGVAAAPDTAFAAKHAKKAKVAKVAAAPKCLPPLVAACTARNAKRACTAWTCTPFVFAPLMSR